MSKTARAEKVRRINALAGGLHAARADGHRTDVRAAGPDGDPADGQTRSAELWLYGVVGGWWFGFDADDVARQLRGLDVDQLHVRLHSPGGNALEGVAISNLLRNHPASVTVIVDGLAASAASVIAMAADQLVMSPGSQLMVHDVSLLTYGNAAELREDADFLDKQSANYATLYAARAGGTAEQWRTVMQAETWYTADEAVAAGLADTVGTVASIGVPPADPTPDDGEDGEGMDARAAFDLEVLVHPAARAAWDPTPAGPTKPPSASAVGSTHTRERSSAVAFTDEQITTMRTRLGIAEDADEATILAALDEALDERADPAPTTPTPAAGGRGVPEGSSVISDAELATLRAGAEAGSRAAAALHERDREAFLDANAAKIPSSLRASWSAQYDRDPAATREALASMADVVPVNELGHNAVDDDSTPTDARAAVQANPTYISWEI